MKTNDFSSFSFFFGEQTDFLSLPFLFLVPCTRVIPREAFVSRSFVQYTAYSHALPSPIKMPFHEREKGSERKV